MSSDTHPQYNAVSFASRSGEVNSFDPKDVMRQQYKELSVAELALMLQIKEDGQRYWNLLDALPASREITLAKTKLEEAVMWASKALSA